MYILIEPSLPLLCIKHTFPSSFALLCDNAKRNAQRMHTCLLNFYCYSLCICIHSLLKRNLLMLTSWARRFPILSWQGALPCYLVYKLLRRCKLASLWFCFVSSRGIICSVHCYRSRTHISHTYSVFIRIIRELLKGSKFNAISI